MCRHLVFFLRRPKILFGIKTKKETCARNEVDILTADLMPEELTREKLGT
jgi:hypothetical protein